MPEVRKACFRQKSALFRVWLAKFDHFPGNVLLDCCGPVQEFIRISQPSPAMMLIAMQTQPRAGCLFAKR